VYRDRLPNCSARFPVAHASPSSICSSSSEPAPPAVPAGESSCSVAPDRTGRHRRDLPRLLRRQAGERLPHVVFVDAEQLVRRPSQHVGAELEVGLQRLRVEGTGRGGGVDHLRRVLGEPEQDVLVLPFDALLDERGEVHLVLALEAGQRGLQLSVRLEAAQDALGGGHVWSGHGP
jgi:hypothetical protein